MFRPIKSEETVTVERDTKVSGLSWGRKDSGKQMMSDLLAAAWIERSVRLEQRPRMFEVHTAKDRGGGVGQRVFVQGTPDQYKGSEKLSS